jgi:glycosyltransferase involved in cell wall biosynthesis
MKNILMIAYYYPPLGGAGVQRTLKFAKYLTKLGHKVSVLTVSNDDTTVKDSSLSDEGCSNINVYRAAQKGPNTLLSKIISKRQSQSQSIAKNENYANAFASKLKTVIKKKARDTFVKIYTNINIPDDKISWKAEAVKLGLDIINNEKIDVIYSTSGPYTSHLIGYEIKRKTNIKWIADFRDQWVANPFVKYSSLTKKINERLERKVVENADSILSVSEPIISDFIKRYKLDKNKLFVLTNGYDEEDFDGYNLGFEPDKFIITYNGTIYGKRSPLSFLKAIGNLIEANKMDRADILIKFVGKIGSDAMGEINSFTAKYPNTISKIDYLPHKDSIKQLEESSALLLIIEDGIGSEGIYTGKVFEYIRSGKTIIGIVPDGVAKDLILKTNAGFCCHPNSLDEISDVIFSAYCIWKKKTNVLNIDWNEVKKYNREKISENLSNIINTF